MPVPPPMPAAMNTMWQPAIAARMSSMASSAAASPISGLEPAPSPSVRLEPELDALLGAGGLQRLRVGVGDDELGAREPGRDHVVDGVSAGAAHADDGDARSHVPASPSKALDGATVPCAAR